MNRWDIFVMTFFYLDAYWDDHQTEELGNICSSMNPFLFEGIGSADPAIWAEFCDAYEDRDYTIEEGYEIAKKYVATLESEEATKAMEDSSLEEWKEVYDDYLNPSDDEDDE